MQTSLQPPALSSIELPGINKLRSGKVREVFDLGDTLLFVVTDRISAFDVILPDPIPHKGAVLNQISAFWFKRFDTIQNHLVTANFKGFPKELQPFREQLAGRSMIVKKTKPLPVECVVRGYLAGSGWKEYQESQSVCGIKLPSGLQLASQLPEPIFTPATKAEEGHDENIDFGRAVELVGDAGLMARVRDVSLALYAFGAEHAHARGILLADTKFELGLDTAGELTLGDEVMTPDSSRFWPADEYEPGRGQASFDKQFVRDWASSTGWDRNPPAPAIPDDVVTATRGKYIEGYELITGEPFARWRERTGA